MSKALSIKNMTIAFRTFTLQDINLEIEPGTIMGLVGANGAGKTTILKAIMNFYGLEQGTISVFESDHLKEEIQVKNKIGYIADEDYLKYNCTLERYAKMFAPLYQTWNWKIFEEQVRRWKLPVNQKFSEFSKGMKTKAMFAIAMAHEPKLLVLDEPTAGLDPVARMEFLQMLREFVEDGERAVLFSTHIATDLDKVADYITILSNGKIIGSGATDWWDDEYILAVCDRNQKALLEPVAIGMMELGDCFEALVRRSDAELLKKKTDKITWNRSSLEQMIIHQISNNKGA